MGIAHVAPAKNNCPGQIRETGYQMWAERWVGHREKSPGQSASGTVPNAKVTLSRHDARSTIL